MSLTDYWIREKVKIKKNHKKWIHFNKVPIY